MKTPQNKFLFFGFSILFSIFGIFFLSGPAHAIEIYGDPNGYCACPSGSDNGGSGYSDGFSTPSSSANMVIVHTYDLVDSKSVAKSGGKEISFETIPMWDNSGQGGGQICFTHTLNCTRKNADGSKEYNPGDSCGSSYDKKVATINGVATTQRGCYSGISGGIKPGQSTGKICETAYYSPAVYHYIAHYFPLGDGTPWEDGYECGDGWSRACAGYFREAEAIFGTESRIKLSPTFNTNSSNEITAKDSPATGPSSNGYRPNGGDVYYKSKVDSYLSTSGDSARSNMDTTYDMPSIESVNNFKNLGVIYMGSEHTDSMTMELSSTINRGIDATYDSIYDTGKIKTPYTVAGIAPEQNSATGRPYDEGGDVTTEMTQNLKDKNAYNSKTVKSTNLKLCNSSKEKFNSNCNVTIALGSKNIKYSESVISAGRAGIEFGGLDIREYLGSGVSVTINRPYNFDLTDFMTEYTSSTDGAIYPGAKISARATVTNRENIPNEGETQEGNHSYSPDNTTIRTYLFIVKKDYIPTRDDIFNSFTHYDDSTVCSYYGSSVRLGDNIYDDKCKLLKEVVYEDGIAPGASETVNSEYTTDSDLSVGDKICLVSEINFVNSKNNGGYNSKDGLLNDSDSNSWYSQNSKLWYATAASCEVVTVRPTTQIWGGDISAAGDVEATVTGVNERELEEGKLGALNTFGSWVDYGLTSNGKIKNFSSGSAIATGVNTYSPCVISPLTISNANCATELGGAGIPASSTFADRIVARYKGMSTMPYATATYLSEGSTEVAFYSLPEINNTGELIVNSFEKGNVLLSGNIISDPNRIYEKASDIPQNIIIVENGDLYISENVTEIDAWLVVPNGTIHTCVGMESGNKIKFYNIGDDTFSSDVCSNQLIVRGPVVAKNIIPLRTATQTSLLATPSSDSNANRERIKSYAERFVLPYSSYIWSYSEATDKSGSIDTVYTRELAPRF